MKPVTIRKISICRLPTHLTVCLALLAGLNCSVMAQSTQFSQPFPDTNLPSISGLQTSCFVDSRNVCGDTLFTGLIKQFEPTDLMPRTKNPTGFLQSTGLQENTNKGDTNSTQLRLALKSLKQSALTRGSSPALREAEISVFLHLNHSF